MPIDPGEHGSFGYKRGPVVSRSHVPKKVGFSVAISILAPNNKNSIHNSLSCAEGADLTLNKQVDKTCFNSGIKAWIKNKETGLVIAIDTGYSRFNRMRKGIMNWVQIAQEIDGNKYMIGLTYRPGEEWHQLDITEFLRKLKRGVGGRLLAYAWVAELQERGAIHYHVFVIVSKGSKLGHPDQSGWWSHGSSRVEKAKSAYYLATYIGKEYQKEFSKFPKGIRCFSVQVTGEGDRKRRLRVLRLPAWARKLAMIVGFDDISGILELKKKHSQWEFIGLSYGGHLPKGGQGS